MFYVYMLTDPRKDGQPFYIGKGQKTRAYKHANEKIKFNQFKHNMVQAIKAVGLQHGVQIIKEFETEREAFDYETELILKFGRRGLDANGILANRAIGGGGTSGYLFTEEQKQKLRDAHTGIKDSEKAKLNKSLAARKPKSADHAKNISKSKLGDKNPMFGKDSPFKGKTHTPEMKQHIKEMRAKQVISEETKLKMAESQRRRHALRKLK